MERTEKTMSYLYSGLGYEYYTAGLLWQMGFEAYKIDADFGFDIMSYNLKERSFKTVSDSKPYFFQVKARRIYKFDKENTGAGMRRTSIQKFQFRKDDFYRLLKEEKSYLVCYFIDSTSENENIIGSFWLNNNQLNKLWDGEDYKGNKSTWKWFEKIEDKIILKAKIQTQADSKETIKDKVKDIGDNIEQIKSLTTDKKVLRLIEDTMKRKNSLESWINNSSISNCNSSNNIYLFATNSGGKESQRILEKVQTEFYNFAIPNNKFPSR